jgi:hypothetical protein
MTYQIAISVGSALSKASMPKISSVLLVLSGLGDGFGIGVEVVSRSRLMSAERIPRLKQNSMMIMAIK